MARRAIPQISIGFADTRWFYRLLEIAPGALTWLIILLPFYLSFSAPVVLAYFIIAFDIYWLLKSVRMSTNLIIAYRRYKNNKTVNWEQRAQDLNNLPSTLKQKQAEFLSLPRPSLWHRIMPDATTERRNALKHYIAELQILAQHEDLILKPRDLYHMVIMPCYKVVPEVVQPSIEAVLHSNNDAKKVIFILAYEERGGEESERNAEQMAVKYKNSFKTFRIIKHPDGIKGELRGKGANITYAGRESLAIVEELGIEVSNVIVTTLDEDNIVDANYFSYLAATFASEPNRRRRSFQPIAMYLNNIWDVPAPMRVIASGNSFWNMIEMTRPHRLRNFAAHAQGLQTLIDTDFWSVTTVVEDGHQYWRTYFTYDGDHKVIPMYVPIYQDAIEGRSYRHAFKNQFVQLRRWAWGVSDFAYAVREAVKNRRAPFGDKFVQIARLLEGHVSWATAPLVLAYYAWLPLLLNPAFKDQVLAHQLPVIASNVLTFASVGIVATIWVSLLLLPPRPAHHKKTRFISMLLQWILLPVTTVAFGAFAALNAQTRLMFGRYLEEFDVTEKGPKK